MTAQQDTEWQPPLIPQTISCGDMPGDKVDIKEGHIQKANVIFPVLLRKIKDILEKRTEKRVVITVCGGSGVGKSGVASSLSFYFNKEGIGSYTLSGDNYPHRIPQYNDAERLRIYRESALKGMIAQQAYTKERFEIVNQLQVIGDDANPVHANEYSWYSSYLKNGRKGLEGYLGTPNEIGFDEIEAVVRQFKAGEDQIWIKRMGREDTQLWYEKKNFADVQVLIIEWTHGNSDYYKGVDIPVLLNSTPDETLAYRLMRNRDNAIDSPFTTMVLEIEQGMLQQQAHKAQIIVTMDARIIDYQEYCVIMGMRK